MKLRFEKTVVHITDEETNDKWHVSFVGTHRNLDGHVFKNGKYITTYSPQGGHANKTIALHIIKTITTKGL
jgi:hypothetical protein